MKDFIKDFTAIDILGIMPAGVILILLLSPDIAFSSWLDDYFSTPVSEAILIVFLITAGYILGLLIHDVGDIIESFLFGVWYFSPLYYAARVTGIKKSNEDGKESGEKSGHNSCNNGDNFVTKFKLAFWGRVLLSNFALFGLLYFLLLPTTAGHQSLPVILELVFSVGFSVAPVVIFCILKKDSLPPDAKNACVIARTYTLFDYFIWLRKLSSSILSERGGASNEKKLLLFDGFHILARNLIIALALYNLYAMSTGWKTAAFNSCSGNVRMLAAYFALIFLLAYRSFRYSYLKYKYLFEESCLTTDSQS